MEFLEKIKVLAARVEKQKNSIVTEEACKNAFEKNGVRNLFGKGVKRQGSLLARAPSWLTFPAVTLRPPRSTQASHTFARAPPTGFLVPGAATDSHPDMGKMLKC
ncbi:MAG: hypothetical protein ACREJ5_19020 [Geminicoccaceae bacterium]